MSLSLFFQSATVSDGGKSQLPMLIFLLLVMKFSNCESIFAVDSLKIGVFLAISTPWGGVWLGLISRGLPLAPRWHGMFGSRSPQRHAVNLNCSMTGTAVGPAAHPAEHLGLASPSLLALQSNQLGTGEGQVQSPR